MRYDFEVDGRVRTVAIEPAGDTVSVSIDGAPVAVEVARVAPGRYSLRLAATGCQHEVAVSANGHDGLLVTVGGAAVLVARADTARGRRAERQAG